MSSNVQFDKQILQDIEKEFAKFVETKQNEIKKTNSKVSDLLAKARKIEFELTNVAYVFESEKRHFVELMSTPGLSGSLIPPDVARIVKSFHSKMKKANKAVKTATKPAKKTVKPVKKVAVKAKKK